MRDYKNEVDPIENATHINFKFDIYRIDKFEEWKKIKTVELINYSKKWDFSGSAGCILFHKRNGKKLDLNTIETYDMYINPENYGIEIVNKNVAFKENYITLETLNTIDLIAENECWNYNTL